MSFNPFKFYKYHALYITSFEYDIIINIIIIKGQDLGIQLVSGLLIGK